MHLYIMRHGLAANSSDSGRDRDRPLTDEGRQNVEQIGSRLHTEHGVRLGRILSSPYLRAAQTAEIMAGVIGAPTIDLDHHDELEPDEPLPTALLLGLTEQGNSALIVGHHPMVIAMLRMLVRDVASLPLGLHPGMLVGIEHVPRELSRRHLDGAFRVTTILKP